MSEPPKVLTAGGAASAGGTPGKKTTANQRRNARRRKKKPAAAAASPGGEGTQQQQEADLLGTSDAVEAGTKPTAATATAAKSGSIGNKGGGGGGGGGKASAKKASAASSPPRRDNAGGGSKNSSGTTGGPRRPEDSPVHNPQTGSPPSDSEGSPSPSSPSAPPPPAPAVLVAGGGTRRGGSGAESGGSRKSENRLPGPPTSSGRTTSPNRRRGDGDDDDDDDDDDDALFHDDEQDDADAERHIGEIDLNKPHKKRPLNPEDLYSSPSTSHPSSASSSEAKPRSSDLIWLLACFLGIMGSFVVYGLLLEYTTSGGRKLHELSFLFVTSSLYTVTAAAGRYVRQETPTSIPPARFAVLGLTSMGSTFCSVRSLRYVIYPIQVLAKSCKPVPVMIMGALMGKKYPPRKYLNVLLIVAGVGLFMGGGSSGSKKGKGGGGGGAAEEEDGDEMSSSSQVFGLVLLFVSLCFDGGTGAYEDKLMSVHSVGPFDLMYNIQLGKTILAGVGLIVLNQVHVFLQMCQDMGFLLVALGLSGAMGQVFIFVTISKFGALTCSIIGLARKVTTLVASIYFYGHELNGVQFTGLVVAVGSMVMNFWGKSGKKKGGGHGGGGEDLNPEETKRMLSRDEHSGSAVTDDSGDGECDIELGPVKGGTRTIS